VSQRREIKPAASFYVSGPTTYGLCAFATAPGRAIAPDAPSPSSVAALCDAVAVALLIGAGLLSGDRIGDENRRQQADDGSQGEIFQHFSPLFHFSLGVLLNLETCRFFLLRRRRLSRPFVAANPTD
jgi:hypothetical protein